MPIVWEPLLLIPLLALVIPVAILIGLHWRSGPLISLSAGATLGVIIFLALTWASFSPGGYQPIDDMIRYLSLLGGAILLLGALALAFADALRTRRRSWAIIPCALVYVSFVGLLGIVLELARYCAGMFCAPPDYGRFALFGALSLAGPLATLIYALFVAFQRQPHALSDGAGPDLSP